MCIPQGFAITVIKWKLCFLNSICLCALERHVKSTLEYSGRLVIFFKHLFSSLLSLRPHNSRRRRELFGVANDTLTRSLGQNVSASEGNMTEPELVERVYPFSETTSRTEFMEIFNLQPFTVYRIDIHACNHEVQQCSAAAFVFSRTKPAGGPFSLFASLKVTV